MSKPIFAPWRIRYILDKSKPSYDGCFMCYYGKHQEKDPENLVVARMDHFFLALNRYPYSAGHLMLCPYRHVGSLEQLSSEELLAMGDNLKRSQQLLQKLMQPQGFNIGLNTGEAAGAGFADHLHFHIIPRWNGDTNFMPVVADIQVIPQALEELREELEKIWLSPAFSEESTT